MDDKYFEMMEESHRKDREIFRGFAKDVKDGNKKIEGHLVDLSNGFRELNGFLRNGFSTKLSEVHKDISTKEGYLVKLSNKISWLWAPIVVAIVVTVVKLLLGGV